MPSATLAGLAAGSKLPAQPASVVQSLQHSQHSCISTAVSVELHQYSCIGALALERNLHSALVLSLLSYAGRVQMNMCCKQERSDTDNGIDFDLTHWHKYTHYCDIKLHF